MHAFVIVIDDDKLLFRELEPVTLPPKLQENACFSIPLSMWYIITLLILENLMDENGTLLKFNLHFICYEEE